MSTSARAWRNRLSLTSAIRDSPNILLARFGIAQLDAIGKARLLIGDVALGTVKGQLRIRQAEEVAERSPRFTR